MRTISSKQASQGLEAQHRYKTKEGDGQLSVIFLPITVWQKGIVGLVSSFPGGGWRLLLLLLLASREIIAT